jgi:Flp pilus assembly protein TadG
MVSLKGLGKARKGGAAVELAVAFPLLLLLLIGVVDYGRVFYTSVTVSNAARAGAEWGQQTSGNSVDTAGMRTFAQFDGNDAGAIVFGARLYCECVVDVETACNFCAGGVAPNAYVEVTATKVVNMLLRYPGLPASITVTRKATFRSQ